MSLLLLFQGGTTAAGFRSLALELGIGAPAGISLEAGSFTVSGQDAGLRRGRVLRADAGSYALDGAAATLLPQRRVSAEAGSYSLSGQDAALTYGQFFGFRSLALELGAGAVTAAAISAEPGTFTVSGQDAALKRGLRLAAEAGSYTYTGVASQSDFVVSAAAGAYSVTGYDATLTKAGGAPLGFFSLALEIGAGAGVTRTLTAEAGSYSLTGEAATLKRVLTLTAEAGSYSHSGQNSDLKVGRLLAADSGIYAVTGQPAAFVRIFNYPDPADVRAGVQYGPGGIYVGTLTVGPGETTVALRSFSGRF